MFTNQYIIRVFSRRTTFFKIVIQDIVLPPLSKMSFFQFPNFYFDKLLYRDERTVNISQINTEAIVVNRSEASLVKQLYDINGLTFNVSIYEGKGDQTKFMSAFNVAFIDRFNK